MIGNLKEIEKQLNQSKGHRGDRINNPIAAAFTHRLAVLLKNSQFGRSGQIDSESRRGSSRRLLPKKTGEDGGENKDEELKGSHQNTGSRGYEANQGSKVYVSGMSGRLNNHSSGLGQQSTQHQNSRLLKGEDGLISGGPSGVGPPMDSSISIFKKKPEGIKRDFMVDYFTKNIFSQTAATGQNLLHISHNDFVKNL